jgi:antirestriction protein
LSSNDNPKIWVGGLAAYTNGKLYGEWIDAAQSPEDIHEDIQKMLDGSPEPGEEEWGIFDYEDFGGMKLSEYEDIDTVSRLAILIEEHGAELVAGVWGNTSEIDYVEGMFADNYLGAYVTLADYMEQLTRDTGGLENVPEHLKQYIDYDSMAHDAECGGDYLQVDAGGMVHLFDNN